MRRMADDAVEPARRPGPRSFPCAGSAPACLSTAAATSLFGDATERGITVSADMVRVGRMVEPLECFAAHGRTSEPGVRSKPRWPRSQPDGRPLKSHARMFAFDDRARRAAARSRFGKYSGRETEPNPSGREEPS